MECTANPDGQVEVVFTDETPYQRENVRAGLSFLLAEGVGITSEEAGRVLRTRLPNASKNTIEFLELCRNTVARDDSKPPWVSPKYL